MFKGQQIHRFLPCLFFIQIFSLHIISTNHVELNFKTSIKTMIMFNSRVFIILNEN